MALLAVSFGCNNATGCAEIAICPGDLALMNCAAARADKVNGFERAAMESSKGEDGFAIVLGCLWRKRGEMEEE